MHKYLEILLSNQKFRILEMILCKFKQNQPVEKMLPKESRCIIPNKFPLMQGNTKIAVTPMLHYAHCASSSSI